MQDTIDMLEAIGQDAGLRYARSEELAESSALAESSEALRTAIREGNSLALCEELGTRAMQSAQGTMSPSREDEPEEEEGDEPNPKGPTAPDSI